MLTRYGQPSVVVVDGETTDGWRADRVTAEDGQQLVVELLGPVRAWRGGQELDLGAPRRRSVLGLLALRPNRAVSRDELIDGMWGDDPPLSSVNALHVYVAGLRVALEPDRAPRAPGASCWPAGLGTCCGWNPASLTPRYSAGI